MTPSGDAPNANLFLSCVSAEFAMREAPYGEARQVLAKYLRRADCQARSQEDFPQHADETLDLLDEFIRNCRAVVHLVGEMPGSNAMKGSPEGVTRLLKKLEYEGRPFLCDQPEALREAISDTSDLSYTEWEAFLALHHHNVSLFVYHTEAGHEAQPSHLKRLKLATPKRHSHPFTDREDLVGKVIADLRKILPELPERKPFNLPGSIGELFKGRETFLETIRETLKTTPGAITQKPQTISGLGGIGKSRLAIEFGWRHADDYAALLFISADSPEALRRNLAELTGPLILDLPEYEQDLETRLAAALRWLETHERWFLIIDNVDHDDAAREMEALLPRLGHGDVLITSRLGKGWSNQVKTFDLEVLDDAAARDFLLDRTAESRPETESDDADLDSLLTELDGLALALEQAGAYIDEREITFAEYLRRFREQKEKVLEWHDERAMQYPASVAATWQTSFQQLSDAARNLLNQLSFLAPEPVPRAIVPEDEEKSLVDLRRLSLVRFVDDPPDSFVVHRLLQEIVRSRLEKEEASAVWEELISKIWHWAPNNGQDISTWEKWMAFEPHAEKVFSQETEFGESAAVCFFRSNLAGYQMFRNASYSSAGTLLQRTLETCERLFGDNNLFTLTIVNNLGELLRVKGNIEESEHLHRRALEGREEQLGIEHPETLQSISNLAVSLRLQGDEENAELLNRRALEIRERLFGEDDPEILYSLNNLAILVLNRGNLTEAENLFRRAMKITEKLRGEIHPDTASTLSNYGGLLITKGELEEAESMFRRSLNIREQLLGSDHPDTLTSVGYLAVVSFKKGRVHDAEKLMHRMLEGYELIFGHDHHLSETARKNCAFIAAAMQGETKD